MKKLILILFLFNHYNSFCQKFDIISSQPKTKIFILQQDFYTKVKIIYAGIDSANYNNSDKEVLIKYGDNELTSLTKLITKKEIKKLKYKIKLDSLPRLPNKTINRRFIEVNRVTFNVKKENFGFVFHDDYKDFIENKKAHSSGVEEDLYVKNTIFDRELNSFLSKSGYLDTSGNITLSDVNIARLEFEISHISENTFSYYSTLTLKGTIKLANPINGNLINEYPFNSTSNITFSSASQKHKSEMYTEALKSALISMVNNPKSDQEFVNIKDKIEQNVSSWTYLKIENKDPKNQLKDAVSSVITIISNSGHGSGCVITRDGYILTNQHVINSDTSNLKVSINNGAKILKAKVIRMNSLTDLALIKVDTIFKNYLNIGLPDSNSVGDDVFAIGTPKDVSLGQSISKGIISGRRKFDGNNYFQTDVSINSGNSGGALIDKKNNLIGIVNAKIFGFGVEGVGFAIPINIAKESLKIEIIKN